MSGTYAFVIKYNTTSEPWTVTGAVNDIQFFKRSGRSALAAPTRRSPVPTRRRVFPLGPPLVPLGPFPLSDWERQCATGAFSKRRLGFTRGRLARPEATRGTDSAHPGATRSGEWATREATR